MKKSLLIIVLLSTLYSTGVAQISTEKKLQTRTVKPNTAQQLKTTDLTVTITNITHMNGVNTISYTLKNSGLTAIDLKQVVMQGTIFKQDGSLIGAGGGTTLLQAGILNTGNEYKGALTYPGNKLYKNISYIYKLKADEYDTVVETNENNNTSEYPIMGYTDPVMSATTTIMTTTVLALKPDLTIISGSMQRNTDGTYTVNYTLRNSGEGVVRVNVNGLRIRGEVLDGTLSLFNSYKIAMANGSLLSPGGTFSGSYTTNVITEGALIKGQQYEYYLTVDSIEDILETNETNNKFKINFRLGY